MAKIMIDNLLNQWIIQIMTKEELKQWREKHKITQQQLASLLGVFNVTIARWEIGTRKIPSFLHLALLGLEKSEQKGGETYYGLRKKKKESSGDRFLRSPGKKAVENVTRRNYKKTSKRKPPDN